MNDAPELCPVCGGPMASGRCPACSAQQRFRLVHRELILLLVLTGVAAAAFFATRAVAIANTRVRLADADILFEQGKHELQLRQLDAAVASFRRAVARDPVSKRARLALADGLAAQHQSEAAEQILESLRQSSPDDPDVTLQLARLEAERDDVTQAVRYFQSTLDALWKADPLALRQIRVELIRFLLSHHQQDRALSELLVLSASLPETDAAAHLEAGRLFLDAGDERRALAQYTFVLRDRHDAAAAAGAAEAAFRLGDYRQARRLLAMATTDSPAIRELRTLTDLVLTGDPLGPGLSRLERSSRLNANAGVALRAMDLCLARPADQRGPSDGDLEQLRLEVKGLTVPQGKPVRSLSRDDVEAGVEKLYRAERAVQQACASQTPADQALLLIGRLHGFNEQ